MPTPDDMLWVVTDGCVSSPGVGATLYASQQSDHLRAAGFFSAKLKKRQVDWSPCEIEALAIAGALDHYGPVLTQSKHLASVLTDSKPCVQAFDKLCRGEFSASPRLVTLLSVNSFMFKKLGKYRDAPAELYKELEEFCCLLYNSLRTK